MLYLSHCSNVQTDVKCIVFSNTYFSIRVTSSEVLLEYKSSIFDPGRCEKSKIRKSRVSKQFLLETIIYKYVFTTEN